MSIAPYGNVKSLIDVTRRIKSAADPTRKGAYEETLENSMRMADAEEGGRSQQSGNQEAHSAMSLSWVGVVEVQDVCL